MTLGAVFPGQGAQRVGMLSELANAHRSVEERFRAASDVLGFDMWSLVQGGPAEDLSATQNTQPVLLTASVAIWEVWQAQGGSADYVAGHSLGEYSALTCAGVLDFSDAVSLVRLRGELMEKAVPRGNGAMAAIMGLDDDAVSALCADVDGVVVAANFNAPGQVVIAGEARAVETAADALKAAGAKRAVMLDVSGPFHSPLMEAAKEEFAQALQAVNMRAPQIPVIQNVTADVPVDLEQLKSNLLEQIAAPVLWSQCVEKMMDLGVDRFVECGPGNVLAGLNRRIAKGVPTQGLETAEGIAAGLVLASEAAST